MFFLLQRFHNLPAILRCSRVGVHLYSQKDCVGPGATVRFVASTFGPPTNTRQIGRIAVLWGSPFSCLQIIWLCTVVVVNVTMVSGCVGVRFCMLSPNEAVIIRLSGVQVVTAGNSGLCLAAYLLYISVCLISCMWSCFERLSFSWGGYCFVPVLCVRVCARARVSE